MSLYSKIDEVMERFDFDKVHRVMEFLKWTWVNGTPTVSELRSTALQCLDTAVLEYDKQGCPRSGMNVSTGGFEATVRVFASGREEVQLVFYVDRASSL